MTTFQDLADWCDELKSAIAIAISSSTDGNVSNYRWWEPGMKLPAAYMWIGELPSTETVDSCHVRDKVRFTLCFMLKPTQHEGMDMVTTEAVIDTALPLVDTALVEWSRRPGVRVRATRDGFRLTLDTPSGDQAEKAPVVEIPIVIPWTQPVAEPTP